MYRYKGLHTCCADNLCLGDNQCCKRILVDNQGRDHRGTLIYKSRHHFHTLCSVHMDLASMDHVVVPGNDLHNAKNIN